MSERLVEHFLQGVPKRIVYDILRFHNWCNTYTTIITQRAPLVPSKESMLMPISSSITDGTLAMAPLLTAVSRFELGVSPVAVAPPCPPQRRCPGR